MFNKLKLRFLNANLVLFQVRHPSRQELIQLRPEDRMARLYNSQNLVRLFVVPEDVTCDGHNHHPQPDENLVEESHLVRAFGLPHLWLSSVV